MRELSLFSGIGCGVLGTKTLGWRTIGYVEFNEYCQQVLAQRIKDGILDRAPIFGDINSFIESGCADQYRGFIDVLSAGFPCQPFSVAGRERAGRDDRNQWTTTLDTIRRTQPRYCLLENVPGLLSRKHRYFEKILKDLSESGYDAKWKVISASELGAPHKRDRLWIRATLANPTSKLSNGIKDNSGIVMEGEQISESGDSGWSNVVPNPNPRHSIQPNQTLQAGWSTSYNGCENVSNPDSARLKERWRTEPVETQHTTLKRGGERQSPRWWSSEPSVGRVVDGCTNRVQRLKALGNGQVPIVARTAWEILA